MSLSKICGLVVVLLLLCAAHGGAQDPQPTRTDLAGILLSAQLCVHEATWAGASTNDCGAIVQTIRARQAHWGWRGRFDNALARTAPRFYARRTNRAWTRSLYPEGMRANPLGWPANAPPFGAFAERWQAVYNRTRAFYTGAEALPCAQSPVHWYGPVVDRDALQRRLSDPEWRIADCGETRNVFIYNVELD